MNRIHIAGLACVVGGLLFWGLNMLETIGLERSPALAFDLVSFLVPICLSGGPLGLLALRASGGGRAGGLGLAGVSVALLGLFAYLAGVLYTAFVDPAMGVFFAIGALFSGIGMLLLGIAVILARQLHGWRRAAPALVGLYYLGMIPIQIVFFIGPSGQPSNVLLAFWGLMWALVGAAIYSSAPAVERAGAVSNTATEV
jgi:hypothetical protein